MYPAENSSSVTSQAILREYLELETAKPGSDTEQSVLGNLMQAWSFASQTDNDGLVSSISAVLALLLKTISGFVAFRELGTLLCRTLLQKSQLELISKSLSSPKQKPHIISPSLRLLTEIVTFDGGVSAKRAFSTFAKAYTFDGKVLSRNLSMWSDGASDFEVSNRRPAVRTNAIRYLLAHLRHQSGVVKSDILKNGNVIRALFEHVHHDPPDVLKEVLDVVKQCVLSDSSIPRSDKAHVASEHNLSSLASLYRREELLTTNSLNPQRLAHDYLLYVCTDPNAGVLRQFSGWYPPGLLKHADDGSRDDDPSNTFDRYKTKVPVRNSILAAFAQTLRPTANMLESELLIQIFRAAPELVADYFLKKSGFTFDPKLTATWIGYASLLFSTIELPPPQYFGLEDGYAFRPPPVSLALCSILPLPLSQAVLTRCLNQKVKLVNFFSVRILCLGMLRE